MCLHVLGLKGVSINAAVLFVTKVELYCSIHQRGHMHLKRNQINTEYM